MTGPRPGPGPGPFRADELDGVPDLRLDEVAAEARVARELEASAARTGSAPARDFVDRVMTAVAAEPVPAPARAAGLALRHGALGAFLASLRDAWQVMTRPGFPMAVRAQAMALVLIVAALAAGSGLVTVGALGLLDPDQDSSPAPSIEVPSLQTVEPAETPSTSPSGEDGSPSASPDDGGSPEPSESAETGTNEPEDTAEPTETADDNGGGSGGGDSSDSETSTPSPTRTPSPTEDGDHETPKPSDTPKPTQTPTQAPDGSTDSGNTTGSTTGDH